MFVIQSVKNAKTGYNEGAMVTFKITNKAPQRLATVSGLGGAVRQIEVCGNYAYITAREDGLFIVDITNPAKPFLCTQYATVEFATGLAVNQNVVAVSCRSFGTELIDVTNPAEPRHLSNTVSGEVQSVYISGRYLYTGCWMEHLVEIYDIFDPTNPKLLSTVQTAGRGDGVFAGDGLLYSVSACHGPNLKENSLTDPEYGIGNALEIFDISDPTAPKKLSKTRLVEKYHFTFCDMWDVQVSYPYAYVSHTFNGVFVFNVSNPEQPVLLERYSPQLPSGTNYFKNVIAGLKKNGRPYYLPFDPEKEQPDAVTGLAVTNGQLFFTAAMTDFYACNTQFAKAIPNPQPLQVKQDFNLNTSNPVFAAVYGANVLYLGCGNGGIKVLDLNTKQELAKIKTAGPVTDLVCRGNLIFSAEGRKGLGVYSYSKGVLQQIARYSGYVRYLSLSKNGRFAVCITSCVEVEVLDISNLSAIHPVLRHKQGIGLLYGKQLTQSGEDYIGCFWQGNYILWFNLSGEKAEQCGLSQTGAPNYFGGVCLCGKQRALVITHKQGYAVFNPFKTKSLKDLPYTKDGFAQNGAPYCNGNKVVIASKISGKVYFATLNKTGELSVQQSFQLPGNPATVSFGPNGRVAIAAIHGGFFEKTL